MECWHNKYGEGALANEILCSTSLTTTLLSFFYHRLDRFFWSRFCVDKHSALWCLQKALINHKMPCTMAKRHGIGPSLIHLFDLPT